MANKQTTTNKQAKQALNSTRSKQTKQALNSMKYEVANELGVNLKQGYNGDLSAKEAGYVGGYMVKKLVDMASKQVSGSKKNNSK